MPLNENDDPDATEEYSDVDEEAVHIQETAMQQAEDPAAGVVQETPQDEKNSQSMCDEEEFLRPETQFEDLTETQAPNALPNISNMPNNSLPSVIPGTQQQEGNQCIINRIISSAVSTEVRGVSHVDLHRLRNRVYANKDDIAELKSWLKNVEAQLIAAKTDSITDNLKFIDGLPLKSHSEVLELFADEEKVRKLTSFAVALLHSHDGTTLREVIDRLLDPLCTFQYVWPGDKYD